MSEPPQWHPPGSSSGHGPVPEGAGQPAAPADPAPEPAPPPVSRPGPPAPATGPWQSAAYPQAGAGYPASGPAYRQPDPAYPYGGGYPPPPPKEKQTLSVVAFVLGVLGCIPLASIAAIVVGAVALAKERAGRAFAVTGIVLGALWTVIGAVLVLTDAPQRFADSVQESVDDFAMPADGEYDSRLTQDLTIGDCFDDPFVTDVLGDVDRSISVVDCAQPHDLEVFDVFEVDTYTTPEEMLRDTDDACIAAFEDFVGIDYYDSELLIYTYYPSEESWESGVRTVTCTVGEFEPNTGSLRGANR